MTRGEEGKIARKTKLSCEGSTPSTVCPVGTWPGWINVLKRFVVRINSRCRDLSGDGAFSAMDFNNSEIHEREL